MSTQSAHSAKKSTMYLDSLDYSSMSNSQIVHATDVAFSHHTKRLDENYSISDETLALNPLDTPSNNRLQLKKRKKDFEAARSDYAATDFNSDFLSGIFQDISQAEQNQQQLLDGREERVDSNSDEHMSICITDDESVHLRKKARTSGRFNSMSRSRKSFSCLQSISNTGIEKIRPAPTGCVSSIKQLRQKTVIQARRVSVTSEKASFISTEATSVPAVIDQSSIHNLVDKVLKESLVFPRLPPTVSESSCNSSNLTQNSLHAVQASENSSSLTIDGELQHEKDTYGWFVDMELEEDIDRADVISAAQESCRASMDEDLSFKAFTAPKKTSELDEEVEWAKAADTVDDVLGEFF